MDKRLSITENWSMVGLAGLLVMLVAGGVSNSGWTENISTVTGIGFMAIIIGLMISRSLLPTVMAHLFSLIIGAGWSFWLVSRLLPATLNREQRWQVMVEHGIIWLAKAVEGGVSYDNLMFILQMGLIIWLTGYLTIWFIFRSGKLWSAILPGSVILLSIFYYAPRDLTAWVLAFLLVSLLLVIRFTLMEHQQHWRAGHVYFRPDINFDFLRQGLIFSVIIIALAWFTPVADRQQRVQLFGYFDREWRTIQNEWNRMFAALNYKPDPLAGSDNFGQSLTLGGPRTLTPHLVMRVQSPTGRYWRAAVYDQYTGNGWESSNNTNVEFGSLNRLPSLPLFRARLPITQTYTFFNDGPTVLYALANPVSLNRASLAKTSPITPNQAENSPYSYWAGKDQPWYSEIAFIESNHRLLANETYQVISLVSMASVKQLQTDNITYPGWITQRYLQLPPGIPQRVVDLAQQITQNALTPFDKATAVEAYLRQNLTYNEKIAAPPANKDKVDYILFELKQAYCDYYATAMIVMLRSVGVPARLAAGYAQGQPENTANGQQSFTVQSTDAHSWVEVFFPSYGWIDFEPTATQPVVTRRLSADTPLNSNDSAAPPPPPLPNPLDKVEDVGLGEGNNPLKPENTWQIRLPFWGELTISTAKVETIALIVMGLAVMATVAGGFMLRRQPASGDLPAISTIYLAMIKLAGWLGVKKQPAQTVYEHAGLLIKTLPEIKPQVTLIASEFVRHSFSQSYTLTPDSQVGILDAWNSIRPQLYRAIFKRFNLPAKIRLPVKR